MKNRRGIIKGKLEDYTSEGERKRLSQEIEETARETGELCEAK